MMRFQLNFNRDICMVWCYIQLSMMSKASKLINTIYCLASHAASQGEVAEIHQIDAFCTSSHFNSCNKLTKGLSYQDNSWAKLYLKRFH